MMGDASVENLGGPQVDEEEEEAVEEDFERVRIVLVRANRDGRDLRKRHVGLGDGKIKC